MADYVNNNLDTSNVSDLANVYAYLDLDTLKKSNNFDAIQINDIPMNELDYVIAFANCINGYAKKFVHE